MTVPATTTRTMGYGLGYDPSDTDGDIARRARDGHVDVKVLDQHGRVLLRSSGLPNTRLRGLRQEACSRAGLHFSQARFTVNGKCITPDDTAVTIGVDYGVRRVTVAPRQPRGRRASRLVWR